MSTRNPSRPMPVVRNQFRPASDWLGYINDMVTCPYNSNHVMKHHKLMQHLLKCEKQMRMTGERNSMEYEKCPYNSLHRYPVGQRDAHFRECKARAEDFMARLASGESLEEADNRYVFQQSKKDVPDSKKEVSDSNAFDVAISENK